MTIDGVATHAMQSTSVVEGSAGTAQKDGITLPIVRLLVYRGFRQDYNALSRLNTPRTNSATRSTAKRTMIPALEDEGYLPPGIHPASIEEIDARFGQESEMRRVQMESLIWLVDLARRAGALRIVVNGSFVTDKLEPNDVDCVLLIGVGFPHDEAAEAELLSGLPFINMELVNQRAFEQFTEKTFATDRHLIPKGLIEVM
jgi:hypothetical protein